MQESIKLVLIVGLGILAVVLIIWLINDVRKKGNISRENALEILGIILAAIGILELWPTSVPDQNTISTPTVTQISRESTSSAPTPVRTQEPSNRTGLPLSLTETPITRASTQLPITLFPPTFAVIPPSLTPIQPTTIPTNTPLPPTITLIPPTLTLIPPTAVPIDEAPIIAQLVSEESDAYMRRDLQRLESLWAGDGVEVDAGFTSTSADDQLWNGWTEIRQRYLHEFGLSYSVENINVRVVVSGFVAEAVSDLIYDGTLFTNHNKWTFRKEGGQWKITTLTFNLPN